MDLRLRPLRVDDEQEARAAQAELANDGFTFLLGWDSEEPWTRYLERNRRHRRGLDLPADRVPAAFLVAEVDSALVGRVSIRHELNGFLTSFGGHIGYGVRPRFRRQGIATEMLRQALVIARSEGVERALLTCEVRNLASAKVIERLGGELEDVRIDPDGCRMRRYWID
ncbi:MAG: GNAT family N-acetyltransferase [Solirubrobacteraceae bacterium]